MIIFQRTKAVLAFLVMGGFLFINSLSYAQEDGEKERTEENKKYFLEVGEAGKERLDAMNELVNESSIAFLRKMDLKLGMNVLEIGCGGGQMAAWFAKKVGGKGHVTAMDISEDQLKIARTLAQSENLENIDFIALSAYDIEKLAPKKFDVIFARALFVHLIDPLSVFKRTINLLKDGGIIITQDPMFSYLVSYPESQVVNEWLSLLKRIFTSGNKDYDLGIKWLGYYRGAGLEVLDYESLNPLLKGEYQKLQMLRLLMESKNYILENNLESEENFNKLADKLKVEAKEDGTIVSFAPNVIIGGRKKAG